ncbi:hypothetical protein TIFTF001_041427 [Ficus carica]|uniref:Uncharacterized protein n=1 Tax=Ficus carica TaxID=3494 RepID=A0AA87Z969_FICCA|nr:hypothetical protein TIFTF001_041427 [Ficus carica]
MLSGYAAAKGFANQMADEVKAANTDARHARRAEKEARAAKEAAEEARKKAEDRAKVAEERAKEAESRQRFAEDLVQNADQAVEEAETSKSELEEALHKAEQELASARAVADFLGSEDFNERVAQMYCEGMRDMKAGFTAANPSLVGVDWSFLPAESEETVAEEPPEEGEVTGTARELRDVIILDDQVTEPEQPAPAESVQATATVEPEPDQSSADQEQFEPPAA